MVFFFLLKINIRSTELYIRDKLVVLFVLKRIIIISLFYFLIIKSVCCRSGPQVPCVPALTRILPELGKLDLTWWEPAQSTQLDIPDICRVQLINQKLSCLRCFVGCNYCRKSLFYILVPMTECLLKALNKRMCVE